MKHSGTDLAEAMDTEKKLTTIIKQFLVEGHEVYLNVV